MICDCIFSFVFVFAGFVQLCRLLFLKIDKENISYSYLLFVLFVLCHLGLYVVTCVVMM